jgi:hypothetical protein
MHLQSLQWKEFPIVSMEQFIGLRKIKVVSCRRAKGAIIAKKRLRRAPTETLHEDDSGLRSVTSPPCFKQVPFKPHSRCNQAKHASGAFTTRFSSTTDPSFLQPRRAHKHIITTLRCTLTMTPPFLLCHSFHFKGSMQFSCFMRARYKYRGELGSGMG